MSQYFDNKDSLFLQPKTTQYDDHFVMTNVHKVSKIKKLTIDTRFRDTYDFAYVANYNITLPERINNVKSMKITNIELPVSYYNISGNLKNNVLRIAILGQPYTVIIPDGQYTPQILINTINEDISNNAPGPLKNVFFFTTYNDIHDAAFCLITNFGCNDCIIDFDVTIGSNNDSAYDPKDLMFKLGWILGFRDPAYDIPTVTTLRAQCSFDLNGSKYLYLAIDDFQNNNPNSFLAVVKKSEIKQNVLGRISMNPTMYPFGSIYPANILIGNLVTDHRIYTNKVNLQRLNVQLVNEGGNVMDMNGMDFSFCLELEYD